MERSVILYDIYKGAAVIKNMKHKLQIEMIVWMTWWKG